MSSIVMATSRPDQWRDFIQALEKDADVSTHVMSTGDAVLEAARTKHLLAVILDEPIGGISGEELVRRLLSVNAMIHVAWASRLTEEEFHEETEGLGILMKLSPTPKTSEARLLAARLSEMSGAI